MASHPEPCLGDSIGHGVLLVGALAGDHFMQLMARELGQAGFAGVEVRKAALQTEVVIRATRPADVLGENGRRIQELTALVRQRFGMPEGSVVLFAERVQNRGMCAEAQAESLKYKLVAGLPVRRACYGVMRFVLENGARGVEVIVTGKLRGGRAKAMKFRSGFMIKTGQTNRDYVRSTTRHVLMRQGVLGIKVRIMLPHDPEGKEGVAERIADVVEVFEPKAQPIAPPTVAASAGVPPSQPATAPVYGV